MRSILVLLSLASFAYSMTDVSIPNTFADSGIIYASDHNENFDSLASKINKNKDTVEVKFVRFTDVKDSTFQKINCDSIRSKPDVDSIQGNPWIDTVTTRAIRGNPDVDSIKGNPLIDTVTTRVSIIRSASNSALFEVRGGAKDSTRVQIYTDTAVASIGTKSNHPFRIFSNDADRMTFLTNGNVGIGNTSPSSRLDVTGGIECDSLMSAGKVTGTTGTFSSNVSVDSLYSTKGIKGTNFTGNVTGGKGAFDSIQIGGGDWLKSYVTGTFSCSLFDNTTFRQTVTAKYVKNGNLVSIIVPQMAANTLSGGTAKIGTIPTALRPATADFYLPCQIRNAGNNVGGSVWVAGVLNAYWSLFKDLAGNYIDAGSGGPQGLCITYSVD